MQKITRLSNLPMKSMALAGVLAFASSGAWASIDCTLTPGSPNTTFNINNLLDVTTPDLRLAVPLSVACSKSGSGARVGYFCMRIGKGSAGTPAGSAYAPRWLAKDATNSVGMQIYKGSFGGAVWGSNEAGAPSPNFANLVYGIALNQTYTFSMPLYVELLSTFPAVGGVNDIKFLPPGTYTSNFNDTFTEWQARTGAAVNDDCTGLALENRVRPFNFTVTAVIAPQCKITATTADIDFGTQSGSATNLQGATNLKVQCTNTTPYFIGLKPGNSNANGAGFMLKGADQIAYQLRQAPGMSGAIWGNTATSAAVGNGVAGTGNGLVKDHPIYATVASADGAVGTYSDTVTVTVNY